MSRLSDLVLDKTGKVPRKGSKVERLRAEGGVGRSAEWRRIAALPRRVLDLSRVPDLSPIWRIKDHGCPGCELCGWGEREAALLPVQSAALLEAEQHGLFAPIPVGNGKELTTLLLADAVRAERAVILTKPRLKKQMLEVDIPRYGRHFRLPLERIAGVVSYSELSSVEKFKVLADLKPDWVFANEAHCLRRRSSMRSKVFWEYMTANRNTGFVPLSGTMSSRSVRDYQKLLDRALGLGAPLPRIYREVEEWARALDVPEERDEDKYPIAPGALLDLLGVEAKEAAFEALDEREKTLVYFAQPGGDEIARKVARRIYAQRLHETPGVVTAPDGGDCGASLVISARHVEVPAEVTAELDALRRLWRVGDRDLSEGKDVARYARQLACGFYYRWIWPDETPDEEWLEARSNWNKQVRHVLRYMPGLGCHSPLMVRHAALRGEIDASAWEAWDAVRGRYGDEGPPKEAVWISDFMIQDALRWAEDVTNKEPGIIWVEHLDMQAKLRDAGLPVYGSGEAGDLIQESSERVVVASLAHRDGKNLQHHFVRNYVVTPPANGTDWQQLLGRTHRRGQRADEVTVELPVHEKSLQNAFAKAMQDARFNFEAHREQQKLLLATRIGLDFAEDREVWNE